MDFVPSHRLAVLGLAILASGCVVGPNFKSPAPPPVSRYTQKAPSTTAATPDVHGGEAQHFVSGADIPADWWTLFHSRSLNALIEQALANSPDLKAAQAALLVAHENVRAQRGAYAQRRSKHHPPEGSVRDARSCAREQCFELYPHHAPA